MGRASRSPPSDQFSDPFLPGTEGVGHPGIDERGHNADAREADGGAAGETLEVGRDGQASELLAVPSQQRETAEVALVLDQRSRMADV